VREGKAEIDEERRGAEKEGEGVRKDN